MNEVDLTPDGHNDPVEYYKFASVMGRKVDRVNRKRYRHWIKVGIMLGLLFGAAAGWLILLLIR
jgi:hypothetical protein